MCECPENGVENVIQMFADIFREKTKYEIATLLQ